VAQGGLALTPKSDSMTLMSWSEFVSLLRRRLWRILSIVAVGIGLAITYLSIATPQYWATGRLIIDTRSKRILTVEEVLPSLPSEIAMIESQVQILRSRRIAEQVLRNSASQANHASYIGEKNVEDKPEIDEVALAELMKQLSIERKGLSYVIDVSFQDSDPKKAAQIANAMIDTYVADQLDTKVKATRDANKWLKARVAEMSAQVRSAEEHVAHYRAQYGLVDAGNTLLSPREIANHATQLMMAQGNVAKAKAHLHQVEKIAATPDWKIENGEAFKSTVIVQLLRQQSAIQRKLGKMISRLGEHHTSVVDAKTELETLKRAITQEIGRLAKTATKDFQSAQNHFEDLKKRYRDRSVIAIGLSELERDAEATRQLYTSLLKRLKETEAQESLETPDVRVVAYAAPPLHPSSPKKALTLAFALVGSLMVGILIAMLEEKYASIKRKPEDIKRQDEVAA